MDAQQRHRMMARIRSKDTGPEIAVRRALHASGLRFRLHRRDLPGTPDIVLPGRRLVIFVHGCFWHQHGCCQYRQPRTKRKFWEPKLARNKARDADVRSMLHRLGWRTLTVWECQLKRAPQLTAKIRRFLEKRV